MSDFSTDDERWAAAKARDPNADGVFVIAVKTTGVVCRPVCPARPLRKNVVFFDALQSALHEGFRPCKRCKPQPKLCVPPPAAEHRA